MNLNEREKKLLHALDWLIFLVATIVLIIFVLLYFAVPHTQMLNAEARIFVQTLLANLIPVPLLFVVSYIAYRRIQTIRDERDRDILVDSLATNLAEKLASREAKQILLDSPPKERDENLKTAKELWLIGVALNKTVHKNYSLFRNKLRQGNKIRVLLMNPTGNYVNLVAQRKINNIDTLAMKNYIELTLSTLCNLKKEFPTLLDIHTIDYPLSFGAVAADIESKNGNIYIEYYFFKTDKDGLHLRLNSKDKFWYDYFKEQIKELWTFSEDWSCNNDEILRKSARGH